MLWGSPMRCLALGPPAFAPLGALLFTLASACTTEGAQPDAAQASDASVTSDAPVAPDAGGASPTAVHWEPIELGEAMANVWGWSPVALPDGRALVLGGAIGADATGVSEEVLVLAPAASVDVSLLPTSGAPPAPRWCGCATWDDTRQRVIAAGGRNLDALGGIAGNTWELDPATGAWHELASTPTPAGVIGCALAHSSTRRATYWFGGASRSVVSDRMYRLDAEGTTWVELDAMGPTQRYDAHLEPIGDGAQLLLFAGSYGSEGAAFYSDVWLFDTETESWSEITVEGATPPGRRTPWVRAVEAEGALLGFYAGFGYDGAAQPLGDLHYFDAATAAWTEIALDPAPRARGFAAAVPGPSGSLGMLLPGLGDARTVRDAFVLVRD